MSRLEKLGKLYTTGSQHALKSCYRRGIGLGLNPSDGFLQWTDRFPDRAQPSTARRDQEGHRMTRSDRVLTRGLVVVLQSGASAGWSEAGGKSWISTQGRQKLSQLTGVVIAEKVSAAIYVDLGFDVISGAARAGRLRGQARRGCARARPSTCVPADSDPPASLTPRRDEERAGEGARADVWRGGDLDRNADREGLRLHYQRRRLRDHQRPRDSGRNPHLRRPLHQELARGHAATRSKTSRS